MAAMRSLVALLVLALLPAAPSAAPLQGVSSFTLANGLTGVVIEDHRAPVVTQMVWYKVGSADEPPGQSGIAHFLEHLMFKGTATLADGEFSKVVAANGGEDNAFTTTDYTAYFQHIAADRLDLVMGMEADRMTNLQPGAAAVRAERDVVLEERRQVVENDPAGPFNEQHQAMLYLNHPYRHPVIGWRHELEALDLGEAMAFYRAHYVPSNAVLVVAGDVDPAEVERMAERHFGAIPARAVSPRVRPQEPEPIAARRVELRDPRVREPYVARLYLAPQRKPGDQAEAAALTVLAELLGSGITSVMARELELGDGIATQTGADYSGLGLDPQSFRLYVVPKPGVALADAEAALDALIARFVAEGPDPAQLERIKVQLGAAEIYALDNRHARARRIGAALAAGLGLDDIAAWPDELQAVTPAAVQAAARAVLRPEASVTGWLVAEAGP
jgi:zinc protease